MLAMVVLRPENRMKEGVREHIDSAWVIRGKPWVCGGPVRRRFSLSCRWLDFRVCPDARAHMPLALLAIGVLGNGMKEGVCEHVGSTWVTRSKC